MIIRIIIDSDKMLNTVYHYTEYTKIIPTKAIKPGRDFTFIQTSALKNLLQHVDNLHTSQK